MEYCPDCIVQMKKQNNHQLGQFSTWLVCPKCGYRNRPENDSWEISKVIEEKIRRGKEKYEQELEKEESD